MSDKQITALGVRLMGFLAEADDCFGRSEPGDHLRTYLSGQLSDLPRNNIKPVALASGKPPRTLQWFLELARWDKLRLRDCLQRMVARDHADARYIGTVDDPGHPKEGRQKPSLKAPMARPRGQDRQLRGQRSSRLGGGSLSMPPRRRPAPAGGPAQ